MRLQDLRVKVDIPPRPPSQVGRIILNQAIKFARLEGLVTMDALRNACGGDLTGWTIEGQPWDVPMLQSRQPNRAERRASCSRGRG